MSGSIQLDNFSPAWEYRSRWVECRSIIWHNYIKTQVPSTLNLHFLMCSPEKEINAILSTHFFIGSEKRKRIISFKSYEVKKKKKTQTTISFTKIWPVSCVLALFTFHFLKLNLILPHTVSTEAQVCVL